MTFESDLYELIRSIKFEGRVSSFQKQLSTDIKAIGRPEKLLIPVDKITNMCKISAPDYNRFLSDNVTSAYRTSSPDVVNKIKAEAKAIADTVNLDNRTLKRKHL